jgi:hypothetical protein
VVLASDETNPVKLMILFILVNKYITSIYNLVYSTKRIRLGIRCRL